MPSARADAAVAESQPSTPNAMDGFRPRPAQNATTRSASGSLAQSARTQRLIVCRETPVRRDTSEPLQARVVRASSSALRTNAANAILRPGEVSGTG